MDGGSIVAAYIRHRLRHDFWNSPHTRRGRKAFSTNDLNRIEFLDTTRFRYPKTCRSTIMLQCEGAQCRLFPRSFTTFLEAPKSRQSLHQGRRSSASCGRRSQKNVAEQISPEAPLSTCRLRTAA